jgi:hypothetical protein
MSENDPINVKYSKIITTAFSHETRKYYDLVLRRPLGVRHNFPSPLDGKRD